MSATLRVIEKPALIGCHSEMVSTDILWCDLIEDARFSKELRKLSQYVVDYRANLKNHLDRKLTQPHLFLLCTREKVRFNVLKKPSYNFLTRKTKFHLLIGNESRKVSLKVKLADHFFENAAHPKVFLEPKFITLLAGNNEDITLSVHDFLFSIGIDLGLKTEVVSSGCTPSPYWECSGSLVSELANDASKFMDSDNDLLIYLSGFDCNILAIVDNHEVEPKSLQISTEEGDKALALMIARAYTIYFLGGTGNKVMLRSAYGNLIRYMRRRNLVRIAVTHFFEFDSEYLHLGSATRQNSPNHEFVLTLEDDGLYVDGELYQPDLT